MNDPGHCHRFLILFPLHKCLMMLWIIFIILLFSLLVYVLFLPIDVVVNTSGNQYYVRLGILAKANVHGDERYLLRIELRTLFMRFYFYPFKWRKKKKKKTPKRSRRKKFKLSHIKLGWRLLKAFHLRRFSLVLDTGNVITNAKLFPVFALLNYRGGDFNVNFEGRNQLVMHIHSRPIRIIKSFINPKKLYHGITL